jgi:hypothetical protein
MLIKATVRHLSTQVRVASIRKRGVTSAGENVERWALCTQLMGRPITSATVENLTETPHKTKTKNNRRSSIRPLSGRFQRRWNLYPKRYLSL